MKQKAFATILLTALFSQAAPQAQLNFSSCASALDTMRRRANNAEDPARRAESADRAFTSERDDYDRCRRSPDIYDLLGDGCASRLRSVRSAERDLESAVSSLQGALQGVERAFRDITSSCQLPPTILRVIPGVNEPNQEMCRLLLRYQGILSREQALATCQESMSPAECNACLVPLP